MPERRPIEPSEILTADGRRVPLRHVRRAAARREGPPAALPSPVPVLALGGLLAAGATATAAALATAKAATALQRAVWRGLWSAARTQTDSSAFWSTGEILGPGLRISWTSVDVHWSPR